MEKKRLDQILLERGLVESKSRAQALILSGSVEVDGRVVDKAGRRFPKDVKIRIRSEGLTYVSRGGLKLEAAIEHFGIDVSEKVALDVGASTGGFSDCLLKMGARRVYAVDVGYGQLHWRLRNDPRVVVMERVNARYLRPDMFEELPELAVVDVSFISLRLILPAVFNVLTGHKETLALVKPQFEVARDEVGKRGVVRDPLLHERVLEEIAHVGRSQGLWVSRPFVSPLLGPKGNKEFFLHFRIKEGLN
jgi:23S rRNA (cytidine1920-2'-O)/16S rRNA (cytidine1409-2'-O)-methyltransferase